MAKKNGILPKNGGTCPPMVCHKEPEMPKRFEVEVADGGFICRERGGKLGYSDKPIVAKTMKEAQDRMAEYLEGKGKKDDEGSSK